MPAKRKPPNFFAQFSGSLLNVTWGIEVKLEREKVVQYFNAPDLAKIVEIVRKLRELHPEADVKVVGGDFAEYLK